MRKPPTSVILRRITGPCSLTEEKAALEFTDRYDALGIDHPDPKTCCKGHCEGTGYVPIENPDWIKENNPNGCYLEEGWEEPWITLWNEAEEEHPTDDGWHFVVCPDCNGTGKKPQSEALVQVSDPTSYGAYADRMTTEQPSFGVASPGRVIFSGEVDVPFHQLWIEEPPEEAEFSDEPVVTPGVNPETVHKRQVNPTRAFDKIPVGFDDIPSSVGMPLDKSFEEPPAEERSGMDALIKELQDILGSHPGGRRELPQQAALKVPW